VVLPGFETADIIAVRLASDSTDEPNNSIDPNISDAADDLTGRGNPCLVQEIT